jgi:hypothetical protein
MMCADYTGVAQASALDVDGKTEQAHAGSISRALTVVTDQSWVMTGLRDDSGNGAAWTNATNLQYPGGSGFGIADSNGPVSPGSRTTTATVQDASSLICGAFKPVGAGGAALVPNLSDTTTVTEAITVLLQKLPIAVSETVTVSDDRTVNVSAAGTLSPTVSDIATVTESVSLNLNLAPSVFDGVTVTEQVTAHLPFLVPSVSDTVTVTESATALLPRLVPSVFDGVTVTEGTPTVIIVSAGILPIASPFDSVTITENVLVVLTRLTLAVSDAVTLTEFAIASGNRLTPSAFDPVTVTESAVALLAFLVPSAFDTVTTTDDVQVSRTLVGVLPISASDVITTTDNVSVFLPVLVPSVFDAIAVTDRAIMIGEVLVGPGNKHIWFVDRREAVWLVRRRRA